MYNLILIVVSIALAASLLSISMVSLPADALLRQSLQKEAAHGVQLLEAGVVRYLDANRDADGNIIFPGEGVDLRPALYPMYGFIPADVRNELTFEITTGRVAGMSAVGICVRPVAQSSAVQQAALESIQRTLPQASAFLGAGCNATASSSGGIALTYWVILNHIN